MIEGLSLSDYLSIVRRRLRYVVASTVILALLGLLWSLSQVPLYSSTATVLVKSASATEIFDPVTGDARGARAITNEVLFAMSDQVSEAAAEVLEGVGITEIGDGYSVRASESSEGDALNIRATAQSASAAATVAQTFADVFIDLSRQQVVDEYLATAEVVQFRVDEVQAALADLGEGETSRRNTLESQLESFSSVLSSLNVTAELGGGSRQVIGKAEVPPAPFAPQTARNVVMSSLLGLLFGVGLAVLLNTLDTSIGGKAEIQRATGGIPNLAIVPTVRDWRERSDTRIVTIDSPQSPTAEAYRTLRAALEFASLDREVTTLQVTSANPGEGKTTTAVNLALAVARAGRRVVLVDGDLRKPRLHAFFDLKVEPGFTTAILGQMSASEAGHLIERNAGVLAVLTSGPLPPGPSELLGSARTAAVFDEIRASADLIIVDSAPVLPVSDALVLARQVDATLIVANGSRTPAPQLRTAVELLQQVDANIIGTVLNQVKRGGDAYGYGYGYGYGYDQDDSGRGSAPAARRVLARR